ncbi:protein PALS2-like isoform X2 [Asterias amurensis]|uniref:protein PALS2-like isoform X2 n=1 Tax=Asterias amurensis TaxID=7602 RepID=UPI003AB914A7
MPVAMEEPSDQRNPEAMDTVVDNLHNIGNSAEAQSVDLLFLKEVMQGRVLQNLVKAHDTLEEIELKPMRKDGVSLLNEVIDDIGPLIAEDDGAAELAGILDDLNFTSLTKTHDSIANGDFEQPSVFLDRTRPAYPPPHEFNAVGDAIRMVGIRKGKDEPLGITLKQEHGEVVVARVIHGGIIEKQGLLHVGDIIKEVNGLDVTNDPDALQEHMKMASGNVTLKIIPSYHNDYHNLPVYVRAFFDYNPDHDSLIPCPEVGLSFQRGDILCIVDREDQNWWQAYIVGGDNATGLIPSVELEERRRAFVPKENVYTRQTVACGLIQSKRRRHERYQTRKNYEFDRSDIVIYEEVQEMPPFQRKTLVLLGAQGVGRRILKNKLIDSDLKRYGTAVAHTSRPPREGEENGLDYCFSMRLDMEEDIRQNRFLEYGEYAENLYGTTFDAIRTTNKSGKMCVLDINPQSLKLLRNSEFLPLVVFIKAPELETLRQIHDAAKVPGELEKHVTDDDLQKTVKESARMEQTYDHLFDVVIVNSNLEESFNKLREAIDGMSSKRQWVPVDWVYDSPMINPMTSF